MYKRLFTAAIIFGMAAHAPPVTAETVGSCAARSELTQVLTNKYHESPRGAGLQSSGQMLEIWASPDTGSFTVLVTFADGTSCIVAIGGYWQDTKPRQSENTAG